MTTKIEVNELDALPAQDDAKYVNGSLLKHISTASFTASIGLLAIFLVDMTDIWLLSLLEKIEITAGMSFVGSMGNFLVCISLALNLAASIIISKYIGSNQIQKAKEVGISLIIYGTIITIIYCIFLSFYLSEILDLAGASGKNKEAAYIYLLILLLTMPIININIMIGSILRSFGNFRASTMFMLSSSLVNLILDPIFIFTLEMEVKGAAIASLLARIVTLIMSVYYLHHKQKALVIPSLEVFKKEISRFLHLALPAILSFVAIPTSSIFVGKIIAQYGDEFLAGFAILPRIWVVLFVGIYALEMVLSPIYGQNLGAKRYNRLQKVTNNSVIYCLIYTILASSLIFITREYIQDAFLLKGEARAFMDFILKYIVWAVIFDSFVIIGVCCLNTIGKPKLSTLLSWCVSLLGIVPGAYFGSIYGGQYGVLIGEAIGWCIFSTAMLLISYYYTNKLATQNTR